MLMKMNDTISDDNQDGGTEQRRAQKKVLFKQFGESAGVNETRTKHQKISGDEQLVNQTASRKRDGIWRCMIIN